ncbi:MAG: magnesium transporter CorA family protein [Rubrivivax sp.]
MRLLLVEPEHSLTLPALPSQLEGPGFLWIALAREELEPQLPALQAALQRLAGGQLVDLHVSDLLNAQLPSHFEDTSWYDLLVFRRLARSPARAEAPHDGLVSIAAVRDTLASIDTSPVGFAVFDRVLLTVHPAECGVAEHFMQRLGAPPAPTGEARATAKRPSSPADLMLRMVNHMVDGYLDLRRVLTRHLGALQQQLLDPRSRFSDWSALLASRNAMQALEDTCEDQRAALQEWLDVLAQWPAAAEAAGQRERELLRVRSRDVLEHIERVLSHVRRLEQSAETAVQMHFSALGHRTNDIMRTLTVLTAIFLPLNLITGFFGMNFDALPLIHSATGVWVALLAMAAVGVGLFAYFRRKRYLG